MAVAALARARVRAQQERSAETRAPLFVWVFLAALLLSMFSGHSDALGLPMALDRPLFLLAIVLLILDPGTESLRWRAVYPVMVLTVVWTLISWISTGVLTDTHKGFALLDRIVLPFAMFIVGALIFATATRRMLLLRTAAVLGIYLGFTAILERLGLWLLVFPRYIEDFHEIMPEWRAVGPFGGGEPLGMTAALTFFMSAFLAYRSKGAWRWVGVAAAVLSVVANAMSMTRSAWLGLALGAAVFVLGVPALRRRVPTIGGVLLGLAGLILLMNPGLRDDLFARASEGGSLFDRVNTNDAAFRIIAAEPLQGIGWGQFLIDGMLWVRQADNYPVTTVNIEIHNVFLSRAAETGIPGAILWGLVVLLGPVLALSGRARVHEIHGWKLLGWAAFFIWFVPSMTSPNPYPMPNFMVWMLWGIAGRGVLVNLPTLRDFHEVSRSRFQALAGATRQTGTPQRALDHAPASHLPHDVDATMLRPTEAPSPSHGYGQAPHDVDATMLRPAEAQWPSAGQASSSGQGHDDGRDRQASPQGPDFRAPDNAADSTILRQPEPPAASGPAYSPDDSSEVTQIRPAIPRDGGQPTKDGQRPSRFRFPRRG
ncbi:MAG: O-antigen ligase family protein [Propionibacteriaceae bacterium]|nr:O-antigen ligase family protein [Propionibacteriaceae bacterium]